MRKKILSKIFISIISLTLISTAIVSSVFAKYTVGTDQSGVSTRPASFDVKFDNSNIEEISTNFAVDGGGAQIGMTVKRVPYVVTVTSTDSEAVANVTLKLSFNVAMTGLIEKARNKPYYYESDTMNGANRTRISCDFEVYKIGSDGTKVKLEGAETKSNGARTWTATTKSRLGIDEVHKYSIEFLVYHDYHDISTDDPSMEWRKYSYDKAEFLSDAVTVDVVATQVDPMQ